MFTSWELSCCWAVGEGVLGTATVVCPYGGMMIRVHIHVHVACTSHYFNKGSWKHTCFQEPFKSLSRAFAAILSYTQMYNNLCCMGSYMYKMNGSLWYYFYSTNIALVTPVVRVMVCIGNWPRQGLYGKSRLSKRPRQSWSFTRSVFPI